MDEDKKTNKTTMTKEDLEKLMEGMVEEQLKAHEIDMSTLSDHNRGFIKELVEESVKDYVPAKKTPFSDGTEDPKGGFRNMAEFAKAVFDAGEGMTNPDEKLKTWMDKSTAIEKAVGSPAQSTGSLQAGGALIPPEFSMMALSAAYDRSTIMPKCRKVPMNALVIEIPFIKDFNRSQGLVAGNVRFRWVAENAEATGSDVEFQMISLNLREANAMVYVGNRLMKFSPVSVEPFITTAVSDALDLTLANAFINGTGTGQPLGVLNADCLISIPKETGQLADTLVYENTLKMFARSYGNGEWYASKTIIPQLGVMEVAVGTGGAPVFIASNAGIASGAGKFLQTLHGMPIHYEEVSPILGDVGDLLYADWSQYLIGQYAGAQGLEMTESAHLKFDFRQHAFQFTFYIDGQPWWPQAMQPRRGDSISPFVGIAARA